MSGKLEKVIYSRLLYSIVSDLTHVAVGAMDDLVMQELRPTLGWKETRKNRKN